MMPTPKSPKQMSSRLLTMKFMQRAAAAAAASSNQDSNRPATPTHSQAYHDAVNSSSPSPKRQKLSSPLTPTSSSTLANANLDLEAISAAIRAEEEKRAAAIARQAAEAGEEEWVIEYPPGTFPVPSPPVVDGNSYGFGDEWNEGVIGRQCFGGFKREGKGQVATMTTSSHNIDEDGDEESEGEVGEGDEEEDHDNDEDDEDGLGAIAYKAKLKAEKRRAEKRKEKNKKRKSGDGSVNLSRLTSISGGIDKGEQQRQYQRYHHNQRGGSGRRGKR
ncbi:uncharacterized protein PADG_02746 [Paracoccidioides brasiliensis Pb18]|uniref:Uncharacterized protein n=1 Tax=Paracoccidioides brasiliensis (strain Pb18) TaxID=502780 RepID=C1G6E1_PARBD|nr:uncharacterized protein PADG_02746 [Paracoccidioides brasiliensis Pb18]EEH46648.1 hypothetical protein PADG_02746 [Paracoccidioides brasiliensis Pb18]